jgi:hypothetical protein
MEQPTCGQGLVEHSPLPAKLGELAAAVAAQLELHMTALDLNDERARAEHSAYQSLSIGMSPQSCKRSGRRWRATATSRWEDMT